MVAPIIAAALPYIATALASLGGAYAGQKLAGGGGQGGGQGGLISGRPGQALQLPTRTPQQMQVQQQLLGAGLQNLRGLTNEPSLVPQQQYMQALQQALGGQRNMPNLSFDPIENRARQQFAQTTIPSIAERFSSLGTGGSQRSSAFTGRLGSAASDLESSLAALRSQYGLQQGRLGLAQQGLNQQLLAQLMGGLGQERGQNLGVTQNLLGLGLTSPFENLYTPRSPGIAETTIPAIAGGAASLLPLLLLSGKI